MTQNTENGGSQSGNGENQNPEVGKTFEHIQDDLFAARDEDSLELTASEQIREEIDPEQLEKRIHEENGDQDSDNA